MSNVNLPTLAALSLALVCISGFAANEMPVQAVDAAAYYAQSCGKCHDAGVARAPERAALKLLSVDRVRIALTAGSMREQAAGLSAAQLDALARWVGGVDMASAASNARCTPAATTADTALTSAFAGPQWNGWGWARTASLSNGGDGWAGGSRCAEARTQMGVWIRGFHACVRSAHRRRWPHLRRQRQR